MSGRLPAQVHEEARRTREAAEWVRLSCARTRSESRAVVERSHATVDASCRLLLEHLIADRPEVWFAKRDDPSDPPGRHLHVVR